MKSDAEMDRLGQTTNLLESFEDLLRAVLRKAKRYPPQLKELAQEKEDLAQLAAQQQAELKILQSEVKKLNKKILNLQGSLEKNVAVAQIVSAKKSKADDNAALKERLNDYIKVIDQCVKYLNRSDVH